MNVTAEQIASIQSVLPQLRAQRSGIAEALEQFRAQSSGFAEPLKRRARNPLGNRDGSYRFGWARENRR